MELCTYYACMGYKHQYALSCNRKAAQQRQSRKQLDRCYSLVGSVGCCDQVSVQLRLQNVFLVLLACVMLKLFPKYSFVQQTSCTRSCYHAKG